MLSLLGAFCVSLGFLLDFFWILTCKQIDSPDNRYSTLLGSEPRLSYKTTKNFHSTTTYSELSIGTVILATELYFQQCDL